MQKSLEGMDQLEKLLSKLQEGTCSAQELEHLNELLKIPSLDEAASAFMHTHWKKCDTAGPVGDDSRFRQLLSEVHHAINLQERTVPLYRRALAGFSKVAAILLLPLLVALYFGWMQRDTDNRSMLTTVSVPLGARSRITLPDGSEVMLNSGSELTYPMSFKKRDHRLVTLSGEGFFKVLEDKNQPFIVRMNDMDLKVTGTSFNARAYNDETNVTVVLVSGSVRLGEMAGEKQFTDLATLRPNDVFTFNKTTKRNRVHYSNDLTKYIAWTRGRTVFDNDEIQVVIDKLEKLYNVDVIVKDPEILVYRLTATFTNESLERALRILSLSSPINYQLLSGSNEEAGIFEKRTLILRKDKKKHIQ